MIKIINEFQITGTPKTAKAFGGGHINKTYKVTTKENATADYLLQKVNHEVFPDIEGLMKNISMVTKHIKEKENSHQQHVLTIVLTKDGELFFKNTEGYWRVFEFLGDAHSYEKAKTEKQAFEAAKMFGLFLRDLSDFPAQNLNETIPNFHNIAYRLKQLDEALRNAEPHRATKAKKQISQVEEGSHIALDIYNSAFSGALPLRVTHNDTKFNNVLLDKHGRGYAVIDLDTVMPGYAFYDVGDGVRTGVVTAEEDEPNLVSVKIDEEKYKAYIKGYLVGAGDILTKEELKSIPMAGFYMAFMMGVRFLTDYLNGNIYYQVKFPEHNYYRARCQLHVAELLKEKAGKVQDWVPEIS